MAKSIIIKVIFKYNKFLIRIMKFELEGTDMKRTTVAKMSKGAHVYLPKEWIGKEVVVVLIE